MSLLRGVIDALLPPGSLWVPQEDEGLDLLFNGIGDNAEAVRLFLATLADIRNPLLTPILPDLEAEFGILPDDAIDEATRRQRLLAVMTARSSNGSLDFMQGKLNDAGFPVTVYANSPAADPSLFTGYAPGNIMGNEDALFGKTGAIFGGRRGMLLVNGKIFYDQSEVDYLSPTDPRYWPLVFFIGGDATRDEDGVLTLIDTVSLPNNRRNEFISLIIKYKPMFTWCGLVANFV